MKHLSVRSHTPAVSGQKPFYTRPRAFSPPQLSLFPRNTHLPRPIAGIKDSNYIIPSWRSSSCWLDKTVMTSQQTDRLGRWWLVASAWRREQLLAREAGCCVIARRSYQQRTLYTSSVIRWWEYLTSNYNTNGISESIIQQQQKQYHLHSLTSFSMYTDQEACC